MSYTDKWYYSDSVKKNRSCISCRPKPKGHSHFGKDNPNYKGCMDQNHWSRICPNCSSSINYSNYEAYRKAKRDNRGCGCIRKNSWACYNANACKLFEEINKQFGWDGQYAGNRGEKHILSYFVDYYEPTLNIVIEYDEKYHRYQRKQDRIRQQEIEQHLGCKFLRIQEGQNWREILGGFTA